MIFQVLYHKPLSGRLYSPMPKPERVERCLVHVHTECTTILPVSCTCESRNKLAAQTEVQLLAIVDVTRHGKGQQLLSWCHDGMIIRYIGPTIAEITRAIVSVVNADGKGARLVNLGAVKDTAGGEGEIGWTIEVRLFGGDEVDGRKSQSAGHEERDEEGDIHGRRCSASRTGRKQIV